MGPWGMPRAIKTVGLVGFGLLLALTVFAGPRGAVTLAQSASRATPVAETPTAPATTDQTSSAPNGVSQSVSTNNLFTMTFEPSSSVIVGAAMHAHLDFTEAIAGSGTSTIFTGAGCTGSTAAGPVVTSWTTPMLSQNSDDLVIVPVGTYFWELDLRDDQNVLIDSDCQQVEIDQATPVITVTFAPANPVAGVAVSASGQLDGGYGVPMGTVSYTAYDLPGCAGAIRFGPETKAIAGGVIPESSGVVFPNAGPVSWKASYSGDDANAAVETCASSTVEARSLTVALTTASVGFGVIGPDGRASGGLAVTADGAGASYTATNAVTVTVTANFSGWTASCVASENSGGSSWRVAQSGLSWRTADSGVWAAFSTTPSTACIAPAGQAGTSSVSYDYKIDVDWADTPGPILTTITYSAADNS
jgi:hypothetical protein